MHTDPAFQQWLVDIRRDLHAHPETAFKEVRTTKKILETLNSMGIDAQPLPGMTGVVAMISGGPGPVIALRADIDALPMDELNDTKYRSTYPGCMHSCGHDANSAIMLGVAKKIMDTGKINQIKGSVKFLFQPAEEYISGAKKMIEKGVLDNPDVNRVLAGHMAPDLPVGTVGIFKTTAAYASADTFQLTIHGSGGHGARPEECIDPIVAGAYFITQIQSVVSRNVSPVESAVITVGQFIAGSAENIIPSSALLVGSIRSLSHRMRSLIFKRLEEIAAGLETTFGVSCKLTFSDAVPVLCNDENVSESLYKASVNVLGKENVSYLNPIMGSEDFAFFTAARPGAIMRLGCRNEEKGIVHPLHSPYFDIDEDVLSMGVEIFYTAIREYLNG